MKMIYECITDTDTYSGITPTGVFKWKQRLK